MNNSDGAPVIMGRYRILKLLGEGASGAVYACQDTLLGDTTVAVKLFPPAIVDDALARARLERELRAAFRVNHDNIVRFYEPIRDRDLFGFSMEYMPGGSIKPLMQRAAEEQLEAVIVILLQICAGLEAIHRNGLLHRDLKLENIMRAEGLVKIADFGLAKEIARHVPEKRFNLSSLKGLSTDAITHNNEILGTPYYIAPEYVSHGSCDSRADIYALGVIAYELITGQTPYGKMPLSELIFFKLHRDPSPPRAVNPACPEPLSALVMTALARSPAQRFHSARAVYDALQLVLKLVQAGAGLRLSSIQGPAAFPLGQVALTRPGRQFLLTWDRLRFFWRAYNPIAVLLRFLARRISALRRLESPLAQFIVLAALVSLTVVAVGTPWVVSSRGRESGALSRACYRLGLGRFLNCEFASSGGRGASRFLNQKQNCSTSFASRPLPSGKRAVTISQCALAEIDGSLEPGMEVSLLSSVSQLAGGGPEVVAQGRLVYAGATEDGDYALTLELTPDDSLRALQASRQGKMKLAASGLAR